MPRKRLSAAHKAAISASLRKRASSGASAPRPSRISKGTNFTRKANVYNRGKAVRGKRGVGINANPKYTGSRYGQRVGKSTRDPSATRRGKTGIESETSYSKTIAASMRGRRSALPRSAKSAAAVAKARKGIS